MKAHIMARSGISKKMVKDARSRLIANDQNVSIDAIRAELGNTGSKTTIHKHLKELEAEETTILDQERHLSEALSAIVAKLASTLKNEAEEVISQAEEKFKRELGQLQALFDSKTRDNDQLTEQVLFLEKETAHLEDRLAQSHKDLSASEKRAAAFEGQANGLTSQLNERAARIDTLEERHQQARESLEHFRQSSKEQRDQERRLVEGQLQQLQMDLKTAKLAAQDNEETIRTLTGDKAAIQAQLANATEKTKVALQDLSRAESTNAELQKMYTAQEHELGTLRPLAKEVKKLKNQMTDYRAQIDAQNQQIATLETVNNTLEHAIEMIRSAPAEPQKGNKQD